MKSGKDDDQFLHTIGAKTIRIANLKYATFAPHFKTQMNLGGNYGRQTHRQRL